MKYFIHYDHRNLSEQSPCINYAPKAYLFYESDQPNNKLPHPLQIARFCSKQFRIIHSHDNNVYIIPNYNI